MSRFIIRAVNSGFKFDLNAPNGQAIATSEVYDSKAACLKGVESVRKIAATAKLEDQTASDNRSLSHPKYELYQDKSGAFRFRLKSRNGKIVAISEGYSTKAACENGIDSIRKNAPDAEVAEAD